MLSAHVPFIHGDSGSTAKGVKHPADDGTAHRADGEDGNIGFGDDRVRHADEDGDSESCGPTDASGIDQSDANADRETVSEGSGQGGALVGKLHGQHDSDGKQAEGDTAQHSEVRGGHGATEYRAAGVFSEGF